MNTAEFNELYNHSYSEEKEYVTPTNPEISAALERFRDRKFGIMFHWGLYSQKGIVESWMLPDEDREWAWSGEECKPFQHMTCNEFKEMYNNIKHEFNPVNFEPEIWAKAAKDAGCKYVLFTTKHHDGFCMWDTKETDFKITSKDCPFSTNKRADIVKNVFDAFRSEGLKVHAYFSKPDWNSPYYWAKGFVKDEYMTRNTSYNTTEHPEIWAKFREFTKKQMLELVNNYGRIECLWLDGGQVNYRNGMDLNLTDIMNDARKIQPWLMVADRTVGGEHENFITPEQTVPDHPIGVPWESCITLGRAFSYRFDDEFKSAHKVIHILCDIVSKGGNLALNIGPSPDGTLPDGALAVLAEIGTWLKKNGYAIYETRSVAPYRDGNFAFTKKNNEVYAIYLPENDGDRMPPDLTFAIGQKVNEITFDGIGIPFTQDECTVKFKPPQSYETEHGYVFTIK